MTSSVIASQPLNTTPVDQPPGGDPGEDGNPDDACISGMRCRLPAIDWLPIRRRNPLRLHELTQAAYQLGVAVSEDPLDEATSRRLAEADTTVRRVRAALPFGRGNIATDFEITGGLNRAGVAVAHHGPKSVSHVGRVLAGQAGTCSDHAAVSQAMHSERCDDLEELHINVSRVIDHEWAEACRPQEALEDAVVLDAWSDGPAVLRRHSKMNDLTDDFCRSNLTKSAAKEILETARSEASVLGLDADFDSPDESQVGEAILILDKILGSLAHADEPFPGHEYPNAMQVMNNDFVSKAARKAFTMDLFPILERFELPKKLELTIKAVYVARNAYHLNIGEATRDHTLSRIYEQLQLLEDPATHARVLHQPDLPLRELIEIIKEQRESLIHVRNRQPVE